MFLSETLETAVKHLAEAGFKAIELWADRPHAWPRDIKGERKKKLQEVVEENSLEVASICPLYAPYGGLNIAHYNDGIREESVRQVKESIEMGHDFGAEMVLVVPGWVFMPERSPLEEARKYAVESIKECASLAADYGMKLGVENTLTFVTAFDLLKIIEEVGAKNVGSYPDVANAFQKGIDPTRFIEDLGKTMVDVHLADMNGTHSAIGKGRIDFASVISALKKIGYKGDLTFEIIAPKFEDVVESRKKIEALIKKRGL